MNRVRVQSWCFAIVAAVASGACVPDPRLIRPGEVREMCFEAAAGDTLVYRFEGSGPLGFNLHYHDGQEVFYPVPEHETAAEKGQLVASADRTYCLMWTNNGADRVTVEASVEGARSVQFH